MRLLAALIALALPSMAQANGFFTLKGHGGPIMDIALSPSGTQVATASFDNSVGLWENGTPRWLEGHDAAVVTLAYLRENVLLSGGDDFTLRLWDGADSAPITRHKGKITDIAVDPSGETVATASWDGTIGLWLIVPSGGAQKWNVIGKTLSAHDGGVNAVAFSDDGQRLYSASSDGTIRLWRDGGQSSRVLASNGFAINKLVLNESAGWLAYGAVDGVTRIINPDTGAQIADFTLDRRPILAMALTPDGRHLAVGDGEGYIMVIDTREWRIARDFRATLRGPVWALAFSADGQTLYAGGLDDAAYAWSFDALDRVQPMGQSQRDFLRDPGEMSNGERQFTRKCSICHALTPSSARRAGPTLHRLFGRRAGTVPDYTYSDTLERSDIIWNDASIDALFDLGPDHYIPGTKMPMQRITRPQDRTDLVDFLRHATAGDDTR